MGKTIISEGKTTNEAIEKGLKQLNVSKKMVDIKVLENENKRSFFSILAPRVVKVEITVKEDIKKENERNLTTSKNEKKERREKKVINLTKEELETAEQNIKKFLDDFIKYLPEETKCEINKTDIGINVNLVNEKLGYLIGHRGSSLNSLQSILTSIASKNVKNKVIVSLDIEGYKEKRIQTLENLADKMAQEVIKRGKSIALEPMEAYERKIIHSRLQNNPEVETQSIGEEPRRKVVIKKIKK